MSDTNCLRLWRYEDAPAEYKDLVDDGYVSDAEWLLFAPADATNAYWPLQLESAIHGEDSYVSGMGFASRKELEDGSVVVVFCHS